MTKMASIGEYREDMNILAKGLSYSPEKFGYTEKEWRDHCKRLCASQEEIEKGNIEESNGIFLYEWNDITDYTGKESGGWYFSQVPGNGEYYEYLTKNEQKLFQKSEVLKLLAKYKSFIEYGPGLNQANKLKKWVFENWEFKGFKEKTVGILKHFGIDVSPYVIKEFKKEYDGNENISAEGINKEWEKTKVPEEIDNACHVMFGGSVGQYTREQLIALIQSMSSGSSWKKSPLFLSFFAAPTDPDKEDKIEKIKNAYRTKEAEQFVMKGIESLGIPREKLEYTVEYEMGEGNIPDRIKVGAKFLKDHVIRNKEGEEISKKQGEMIWAVSSRRYTEKQFGDIMKDAGVKNTIMHGEEGMKLAQGYLPRKKWTEKAKKWGKNLALALAGSVALTLGTNEYNKYSTYQDAREYAMEKIAYKNIEHVNYKNGINTSYYNNNIETRGERIDQVTESVYDIAVTQWREYDFPEERIVKAAILRLIPDHISYFKDSYVIVRTEKYISFVYEVLMPYLTVSFGGESNTKLYGWLDEYKSITEETKNISSDFSIDELSSNTSGSKMIISRYRSVSKVGLVYVPDDKNKLVKKELGIVSLGLDYGSKFSDGSFFVLGTLEDGYSIQQAQEWLEYTEEKGYVGLLVDKISSVIDPLWGLKYDNGVFKETLRNYLVEQNNQGYDFSWMVKGDKTKEIKKFISCILLKDTSTLSGELECVLKEQGVDWVEYTDYTQKVETMMKFLDKYYSQGSMVHNKKINNIGVRNFLMEVLLSGYLENMNSHLTRHDEPLWQKNIHGTMKRLSSELKEYGYDIEENENVIIPLENLYKNYSRYEGRVGVGMDFSGRGLRGAYAGNVVFTSDGRAFILNGSQPPVAGFELTDKNSYAVVSKRVPPLQEKYAQEVFEKNRNELHANEKMFITKRVVLDLEKEFHLTPTYEAAYEVAKDRKHKFK